jgi:hypothetical protein
MKLDLTKVYYKDLNSKEKENYNYHKVAAALAEYGYDSMRLNNDWQGADFIAVKGDEMIKVQLKSRFTLDAKYEGKNIYIAFIEDAKIKIYLHDEALNIASNNIIDSESWRLRQRYNFNQTPKRYNEVIQEIG